MIYEKMPSEEYHADPAEQPSLSNSIAHIMLSKSPAHAFNCHPRLSKNYQPSESSRFDIGTAAHDLILEGGTAKICVIDPQEHRSKPNKANPEGAIPSGWTNGAMRAARDQARSNGLVPVLPWDNAALRHMVEAAHEFLEHTELRGILKDGKPEQTLIWQEDGADVPSWSRSRLDWWTNDRAIILDYKTCANANPEAFIRGMGAFGYDMQCAFYRRGAMICGDMPEMPAFVFLCQEIEAPYACSLVSLSRAYLEIAEAKVERAISIWQECMASGKWPGYPSQVCYGEPPAWVMQEHEAAISPFGEKP